MGEVYNIGAGNEFTNLEITNMIISDLKKPKSLMRFVKDRPGHDKRYSVDTSKIRDLGWVPRTEFKDALSKTIKWYSDNKPWWQKIKSGEFLEYYKKHYYGKHGLGESK
jgi:dTDP-glucose 4,6-dehydratase